MSLEVYGDDGNPVEHGRDTQVYQQLQHVRGYLRDWLNTNRSDLEEEQVRKANKVAELLEEISDELNVPL